MSTPGADWFELQRKYWDNWSEMSKNAMGPGAPLQAPWEGAMKHWWDAVSPSTPDAAKGYVEKMMEQGKAIYEVAETFTKGLGNAGDSPLDSWNVLNKTLDEMQSAFSGSLQDGDNAFHRMMGFWEMPYDNWQRLVSSLSPVPGDFLRNMPHDQVRQNLDKALSAPGLGYTREEQGQYQELIRCGMDYQKAQQEYMAFFSQVGVKAVGRMRSFLEAREKEDKVIDSGRSLYDSWVGCCEEVYAEEVKGDDYARISGHLVNSQMALKKRMSIIVDENLGAMNMPTRSELRTLQDRVQETRRENKRLRRDLESLKKQVAELANAKPTQPAARPVPRKAPASAKPRPSAAPRKAPVVRKKATVKAAPKTTPRIAPKAAAKTAPKAVAKTAPKAAAKAAPKTASKTTPKG